MTYKSNTVLFAGGPDDLDEAKKYIKRYGLSKENVSIIRGGTSQSITVRVRNGREVKLREGDNDPATVPDSGP